MTINVFKTLKLDSDFDLVVDGDGKLVLVESEEKVQQDLTYLLHLMVGEDIFNPEFGTNLIAMTYARTDKELYDIVEAAVTQYEWLFSLDEVELVSIDRVTRTMVLRIKLTVGEQAEEITTSVVV